MKQAIIRYLAALALFAGAAFAQVGSANPVIPGGGGSGGSGDVTGPSSSTDNAFVRFDSTTGKIIQTSNLTCSDVSGVTTTLATITPAATTGATVAGQALAITASPAVASTDTAGAAAGGSVTITAGAAARNTSGNANGGNINLVTGAGTGTGTAGSVLVPAGAVANPSIAAVAEPTTGIWMGSGFVQFGTLGVRRAYITNGNFQIDGMDLHSTGVGFLYGFQKNIEASVAGSGAPNVLGVSEIQKLFTNEGSTAANYHTLTTATVGHSFSFCVQDADGLRVVANTSDTIRVIDKVTAAAGYIESTTVGSCVTLIALNAVEWFTTSITGVWTDGTFTYDDTSLTTP